MNTLLFLKDKIDGIRKDIDILNIKISEQEHILEIGLKKREKLIFEMNIFLAAYVKLKGELK